jgi:hypothetical protein
MIIAKHILCNNRSSKKKKKKLSYRVTKKKKSYFKIVITLCTSLILDRLEASKQILYRRFLSRKGKVGQE